MNTPIKLTLLVSTACLLTAGIAAAQPMADLDGDGKISKYEFVTEANARFESTDTNSDGVITEAERQAHKDNKRSEIQSKMFGELDANGDGVITRSEFDAKAEERHSKMEEHRDINGDGVVDRADRDARREKFRERFEKGGRDGRHEGRHEGRRLSPDANDDGVVTRAEHESAVETMFERLDVNADGFLEKGEGRKRSGKRRKMFGR